ncbi:hypothetical protein [Paenibacillus hemerocallicola]|nr:hypothetical protein [Paenibacillus hemerocallicola]
MKRKLDLSLLALLLIILISVLTGALIVLSYLLIGSIKAADKD